MIRSSKARIVAISMLAALASAAWPQGFPTPSPGFAQLDPLPHELHPDTWPQPDYFSEALKFTRFHGGERWRALKLAGAHEPDVLVMPVQMQVFGWTPAFAAILGARLDHELAGRRVDANRQTDLFDAEGPYARRFSDAETAAFAQAHPTARVLALYIGRDGAGKDFVTLTLGRDGQARRAHRTFAETPMVTAALDAFSANFPAMLDELGLAGAAKAGATETQRRCEPTDWALADLRQDATLAERACRAIAIGTLLPEFSEPTSHNPRIKTGDKLAWLAEAWVESDALSPDSAAAVRAVAWSQFELTPSYDAVASAVDSPDPVARALARALWAGKRTARLPSASARDARDDYAQAAAAGLPPFARAALVERAEVDVTFRPVRLCNLELELPALRMPADCVGQTMTTRREPPTRGERALLDAWRLARAFKALVIAGVQRGVPEERLAVLEGLPPRIAAHPIIRMERFATENFDAATGTFEALVARARTATADFAQATADVQRLTAELVNHAISYGRWTTNGALAVEPEVNAIGQEEYRMVVTLGMDGFVTRDFSLPTRALSAYMNLLGPAPVRDLRLDLLRGSPVATPSPGASASAVPVAPRPARQLPIQARVPDLLADFMFLAGKTSPDHLAEVVAQAPQDLDAITDLAMLRLRMGQSVAQARALIDARPVDRRGDSVISESHAWAMPAHALYFAGELDAAAIYYRKVVGFGSYSASDLQARVRLRLISGDVPGALRGSRERLERYEDDFTRRDIAGLEFMTGHPDRAWDVLKPRLALSDQSELWVAVQVGQRLQHMDARRALAWISEASYGHAIIDGADLRDLYLLRFMTDDRVPSADDLALLAERRANADASHQSPISDMQAQALLKKLAASPTISQQDVRAVHDLLAPGNWSSRTRPALKPLYAWALWHASDGQDPNLDNARRVELVDDFDAVLTKAVVVGLDGRPDEALRFLRAARYDLARTNDPRRDIRSASYTAAYVAWLLAAQTKDARYRAEALRLATSYERIFPFLAWPYALEALLLPDGAPRTTAACRAAVLDRDSLFLALSTLTPDPRSAVCRKRLW